MSLLTIIGVVIVLKSNVSKQNQPLVLILGASLPSSVNFIEGGLRKGVTTLPDYRGYLEVDYRGNSQESKLDCIGKLSALIYAQCV